MAIIDVGNFSQDLNIIGVVSLFGGEIALSALRYTILVRNTWTSIYLAMVVSAGLQTISLKMFKRMHDRVSAAISPGIRDDLKEIAGLNASGQYPYFGIHSGTDMTVSGILGEAMIRYQSANPIEVVCTRRGGSPGRRCHLKIISVGKLGKIQGQPIQTNAAQFGLIYLIPLITIFGTIFTILIGDYVAFVVIVCNVICNMLVVFSVRATGVKYPIGNASSGVPRGDILIKSGDGIYLVLGEEDPIQYLFQKQLVVPPSSDDDLWKNLQKFVAYASYIIVIANIIATPFATIFGQLIFGILMLSGLVQNILLATFDGDRLLSTIAEKISRVTYVDEYVFETRSSMIAFCALVSKPVNDTVLRRSLPETPVYETWFQSVMGCITHTPPPSEIEKDDVTLLDNLNADLRDAYHEYKQFVRRHQDESLIYM